MIEIDAGSFVLNQGVVSWHGIFSFIAVGAAVFLVGRWAPSRGVDPDDVYSIAVWAIIGGILGARFVHVVDNLDYYIGEPISSNSLLESTLIFTNSPLGTDSLICTILSISGESNSVRPTDAVFPFLSTNTL